MFSFMIDFNRTPSADKPLNCFPSSWHLTRSFPACFRLSHLYHRLDPLTGDSMARNAPWGVTWNQGSKIPEIPDVRYHLHPTSVATAKYLSQILAMTLG